MVKAEINYNPYLRETYIKFNGQEPRINSLVEKYQSEFLQTWVKKIPKIFYDEMNGYDFELEFTGTKLDFQDVVNAFREAGVSEEKVRIFHKNELSDRIKKDAELDSLLEWMRNNKNPRFNMDELIKENADLFDSTYPLILMHGDTTEEMDFGRIKVAGEVVNHVSELDKTELVNTPIVFFLDRATKELLQEELQYLLTRSDVTEQQLFFMIHSALDHQKMERIIRDLGIRKPQIVHQVDDDQIEKYLRLYPVSEYLYQALSLLHEKIDALTIELQAANATAIEANREIHTQINVYDAILEKLKNANTKFKNRDNLDLPDSWATYKNTLRLSLNSWRSRKTKITGEVEGSKVASEFNSEASSMYWTCIQAMQEDGQAVKAAVLNQFADWYREMRLKEVFDQPALQETFGYASMPTNLESGLLKLQVTEYVNDRPNFMDFFKGNIPEISMHPVTVYYLHQWRDYAVNTLTADIDQYTESYLKGMEAYLSEMAEAYIQKIEELIQIYSEKKAEAVSQLSEEEHLIQMDNDWVTTVRDQINEIERG